jgi:antitoxin component of MazEF toxin-antitoxin module
MVSLEKASVHKTSGSMRMRVPPAWIKQNGIKNKQQLDMIVSHALIVLPTRTLSKEEINETIEDFKSMIAAANIISQTRGGAK